MRVLISACATTITSVAFQISLTIWPNEMRNYAWAVKYLWIIALVLWTIWVVVFVREKLSDRGKLVASHAVGSGVTLNVSQNLSPVISPIISPVIMVSQAPPELGQRIGAADWRDLRIRFETISARDTLTFADWSQIDDGVVTWSVRGVMLWKDCEALCRLAGALLVKSPTVAAGLSVETRAEHDPLRRWLTFLKNDRNILGHVLSGVGADEDGTKHVSASGRIENLAAVSARECVACEANEV